MLFFTPIRLTALTMVCIALILSSACQSDPQSAARSLEEKLNAVVDQNDDVHAALLGIDSPALDLNKQFSVGAQTDSAFLSASIGKLFIAVTVLKMIEENALNLDDSIDRFLDPSLVQSLISQTASPSDVTVKMLLSHTSGMPDYFEPQEEGAMSVLELMQEQPDRTWTREQLLQYCAENFSAVRSPGEGFYYADTNYDLLSMIIESVSQRPFEQEVRASVIDHLDLQQTWYHALEPAKSENIVDTYIDSFVITDAPSLSADLAGGGLYTTLEDLKVFMRALGRGELVSWQALKSDFSDDAIEEGIDVGLGLWRIRPDAFSFLLGGFPNLYGHSGATGSFAYYVEEYDAVIVGSFNQTNMVEKHFEFLLADVMPILGSLPLVPQ